MADAQHGQKWNFPVLLLLVAITLLVHVDPARADPRPVYVAGKWQEYLRLVSLSVRDGYVPLLYSEDGTLTAAILKFAELYSGTPLVLDTKGIDHLIDENWPRAETIVVSQNQRRLGLSASAIAAALDAPLYFDTLPRDSFEQPWVQQVIAIGDVAIPGTLRVLHLDDAEEALSYYDTLIGDTSIAVLATDGEMAFLAAEVAAYHRGALLLEPAEIPERRPRYLAWVTDPAAVNTQVVKNLYARARFTSGSRVYDAAIGILTGFNPHDMALLIARAYAYPELQGEWKTRLVKASTKMASRSQTSKEGLFEIVTLEGNALSENSLLRAIRSAGYAMLEAHGSPTGFALANRGWPSASEIGDLPPLVFVAEGCETGNLANLHLVGIEHSVALRLVASGAVAYIGSMEVGGVGLVGKYPFAFSTPRLPLGELVRLQNAARMDVDADWPRVILIGDPTFHQFEREWIDYGVLPGRSHTRVGITSKGDPVAMTIALEFPGTSDVAYAEAFVGERRYVTYVRGSWHFDLPFSAAPAFDRQIVLLEWPGGDGEIVLYPTWPLEARLRHMLSDSLVGVQAIFIDLMTLPGTAGPIAVLSIGVLLVVWRKRTSMDAERRWTGVLVGLSMSVLATVYCITLGFSLLWPMIVAVGCGATTAAWIVSSERFMRVVLAMIIYLAPLFLVWLIAALIGVSSRTHMLIAWGLSLVGIAYGAVVLVSEWTVRTAARLAGLRRSYK